jgi:hypothetical protein
MDESGSGKESWIMTRWSCSDVVVKVDGLVVPVPGSKECHADRNSNEMYTLQSEERDIWEETPSGKAQVGGEVQLCWGCLCENGR